MRAIKAIRQLEVPCVYLISKSSDTVFYRLFYCPAVFLITMWMLIETTTHPHAHTIMHIPSWTQHHGHTIMHTQSCTHHIAHVIMHMPSCTCHHAHTIMHTPSCTHHHAHVIMHTPSCTHHLAHTIMKINHHAHTIMKINHHAHTIKQANQLKEGGDLFVGLIGVLFNSSFILYNVNNCCNSNFKTKIMNLKHIKSF